MGGDIHTFAIQRFAMMFTAERAWQKTRLAWSSLGQQRLSKKSVWLCAFLKGKIPQENSSFAGQTCRWNTRSTSAVSCRPHSEIRVHVQPSLWHWQCYSTPFRRCTCAREAVLPLRPYAARLPIYPEGPDTSKRGQTSARRSHFTRARVCMDHLTDRHDLLKNLSPKTSACRSRNSAKWTPGTFSQDARPPC